MRPGLRIVADQVKQLGKGLSQLTGTRVLVGVPESMADARPSDHGEQPLNNAEIAYIQDNGAPEAHIPARPFMVPGIKNNQAKIEKRMVAALKAALDGDAAAAERQYVAVGLETTESIRKVIRAGIPPPLAESTLRGRIGRRATGRLAERRELIRREDGGVPSTDLVKPLIDTGALVHALAHVIRKAASTP